MLRARKINSGKVNRNERLISIVNKFNLLQGTVDTDVYRSHGKSSCHCSAYNTTPDHRNVQDVRVQYYCFG
jgi:hypothetical protein